LATPRLVICIAASPGKNSMSIKLSKELGQTCGHSQAGALFWSMF
jgi:hypothetical protein